MVPDAGEKVTPSGALALQRTSAPVTVRVSRPEPPLVAEYFVGFTVAVTAACFGLVGLVSGAGVVGVRDLLGGTVDGRVGCGAGWCGEVVRGCVGVGVGVGEATDDTDDTATLLVVADVGCAVVVEGCALECGADRAGCACVAVRVPIEAAVVTIALLEVCVVASAAVGRESGEAAACSTTPPAR